MLDTVTAARIAAAGCRVARVDCGLGPVDLWEFLGADGVNASGRSFLRQRDAAVFGIERIDAGLETDQTAEVLAACGNPVSVAEYAVMQASGLYWAAADEASAVYRASGETECGPAMGDYRAALTAALELRRGAYRAAVAEFDQARGSSDQDTHTIRVARAMLAPSPMHLPARAEESAAG